MALASSRRPLISAITGRCLVSLNLFSAESRSCQCSSVSDYGNRYESPATQSYGKVLFRTITSKSGYSPLKDVSPNWSNRPPKETILLDGCDYEHWLIVMEFPNDPKPSNEEKIDSYVKTLAQIVGSEEEAKKKIYSVCTTTYDGFGALISEELSYKVKGQPGVLWVLPDSYLDVPNKDYGGDLFVDGKVIPRPQYWFTGNENQSNGPRPRSPRRRQPHHQPPTPPSSHD